MYPKNMLSKAGKLKFKSDIKTMICCASRSPHNCCCEAVKIILRIKFPLKTKLVEPETLFESKSKDSALDWSIYLGNSRLIVSLPLRVSPS